MVIDVREDMDFFYYLTLNSVRYNHNAVSFAVVLHFWLHPSLRVYYPWFLNETTVVAVSAFICDTWETSYSSILEHDTLISKLSLKTFLSRFTWDSDATNAVQTASPHCQNPISLSNFSHLLVGSSTRFARTKSTTTSRKYA